MIFHSDLILQTNGTNEFRKIGGDGEFEEENAGISKPLISAREEQRALKERVGGIAGEEGIDRRGRQALNIGK